MERIAMVARWKPVHVGHAAVLQGLVDSGAHCWIGIGSSNRYDASNPFTAAESAAMIRTVLGDAPNYTVFEMPDFGDGPRWRDHLCAMLGPLDAFVTANPYVATLMAERYPVVQSVRFVPVERRCRVDGQMVRDAMARGEPWQHLVPPGVAGWMVAHGLVDRFRKEFRHVG